MYLKFFENLDNILSVKNCMCNINGKLCGKPIPPHPFVGCSYSTCRECSLIRQKEEEERYNASRSTNIVL
jgi:hypothetical protein